MQKAYTLNSLSLSLKRQKIIFDNSLILNPTENIPIDDILSPASSFLHGLYLNDKYSSNIKKEDSKIIFAGRNRSLYDMKVIYEYWAKEMGAQKASMRLLSGLNAHATIFMGIAKIGDKVLLLSEEAGGHFSTKSILERLGLVVLEIPIDYINCKINIKKTKKLIEIENPNFLFFDRTEGLVYEDCTELLENYNGYSIFDASQYLAHILAKDYKNPFKMGFDLVLATLHKNLPGPQKAIVFSKENSEKWEQLNYALETYISNFHGYNNYIAGLTIKDKKFLKKYSKLMIENTLLLEKYLKKFGFNLAERDTNNPATQHIWIKFKTKKEAYSIFKKLEKVRILTNYRLLAYNLGHGLRIGTAAATMSGLNPYHIKDLASYIAKTAYSPSLNLKHEIRKFILKIKLERLH